MRFVVGLFVGIIAGVTGTILFNVNSEKIFALATEWKAAAHIEPNLKTIDEQTEVSAPLRAGTNEPTDEKSSSSTSSPPIAPPQYSSWIAPFISTPSGTQPTTPTSDDGRLGDSFDALKRKN